MPIWVDQFCVHVFRINFHHRGSMYTLSQLNSQKSRCLKHIHGKLIRHNYCEITRKLPILSFFMKNNLNPFICA
jgi:hypothetical protein